MGFLIGFLSKCVFLCVIICVILRCFLGCVIEVFFYSENHYLGYFYWFIGVLMPFGKNEKNRVNFIWGILVG